MLSTSLSNYINEACPELSSQRKRDLQDAFFRMIRSWAKAPEDQRRTVVQVAVAQIREQFARSPKDLTVKKEVVDLSIKVSKRARSADQVRKSAQDHADAWSALVASVPSDIKNLVTSVEAIEEYPGEAQDYYLVKTRLSGENISETLLRNAYGRLKRANKKLAAAAVKYSWM